jgi:hypothetical protein
VTAKVKFSLFKTIWGFNFIPWERVIFFYVGSFSRKGRATPEKNWKVYNRLADEILSNVIDFRRQHPCPFHFHLFCFEANINIQFPHPFTPIRTPSIQVFHYFCLSLFAGWSTSVLSFRCLFLGGKYFKSMFCWHIKRQQWVKVNWSKPLRDFQDFSLDSTSNIRTRVIRTTGFQSQTKLRWLRTNDTDKPVEL